MEITLDLVLNTVFYVGSLQGIILTFLLFNASTNKLSNRLLGILTFLWAIILLVFVIQSYGLYTRFPQLIRVFYHMLFAWFPLLFLSVKYLFSDHSRFVKSDLFHFLPLIISLLLHVKFFSLPGDVKLDLIQKTSGYFYTIGIIGQEVLSLQGIVYTIWSLLVIKRYKKNAVNLISSIDTKVISGYKVGVVLALIAWSVGIIAAHAELFGFDPGIDLFLIVYLIFVGIIYWLSILMLRSPEIYRLSLKQEMNYEADYRDELPAIVLEKQTHKIESDYLEDIDENQKLNQKLVDYLEQEKPYLDPELSLFDLASQIGISRHQLSALINQYQKKNFFELINSYRVNEVVKLMASPESSIKKNYELAYEAGFNSKASFYRIFKHFTGKTPSEFRHSVT